MEYDKMTGLEISEINKIWSESFKQQAKRKKLYDCPYPPLTYSSTTGETKKELTECRNGPGTWCKMCSNHTRWQKQRGASKRIYTQKKKHILESYTKTGLLPHLRHNPSPLKITDPWRTML